MTCCILLCYPVINQLPISGLPSFAVVLKLTTKEQAWRETQAFYARSATSGGQP